MESRSCLRTTWTSSEERRKFRRRGERKASPSASSCLITTFGGLTKSLQGPQQQTRRFSQPTTCSRSQSLDFYGDIFLVLTSAEGGCILIAARCETSSFVLHVTNPTRSASYALCPPVHFRCVALATLLPTTCLFGEEHQVLSRLISRVDGKLDLLVGLLVRRCAVCSISLSCFLEDSEDNRFQQIPKEYTQR